MAKVSPAPIQQSEAAPGRWWQQLQRPAWPYAGLSAYRWVPVVNLLYDLLYDEASTPSEHTLAGLCPVSAWAVRGRSHCLQRGPGVAQAETGQPRLLLFGNCKNAVNKPCVSGHGAAPGVG